MCLITWDGVGGFLVITVSHPTFCCVGVGLWLRWGWAVTITVSHPTFCCVGVGLWLRWGWAVTILERSLKCNVSNSKNTFCNC